MRVMLKILLILAEFVLFTASKPRILTGQIFMVEGNNFFNYIYFDSKEEITSCSASYVDSNNNTVVIPLLLKEEKTHVINSAELKDRISSVGNGNCGIKLSTHIFTDPKNFTLIAKYNDDDGTAKVFSKYFITLFYEHAKVKNQTINIRIGDTGTSIRCGIISQMDCKIFNPKGELMLFKSGDAHSCKYDIRMITMDHIGLWKCTHNLRVSMPNVKNYVDVQLKSGVPYLVSDLKIKNKSESHANILEEANNETWIEESNGYAKIGCKYNESSNSEAEYCRLEAPGGEELTIKTGYYTDRYTTFGSNLTDWKCQIEFELPLQESEIGNWICIIGNTGRYIYTTGKIPDYPKYTKKSIELIDIPTYTIFEIKCQVPYSTKTCSISSPAGDIYPASPTTNFQLGECLYENKFAYLNSSYLGNWTCHYTQLENDQNDSVIVEVWQLDVLKSIAEEIEADEAGSAELMCKIGIPLSYCQYVDPLGNTYHMLPSVSVNDTKYIGRGLEYGDCGMEILKLKLEHEGNWMCKVRVIGTSTTGDKSKYDHAANITLIVVPSSTTLPVSTPLPEDIVKATPIGLIIGIPVAVIVVLTLLIYRRYRKNKTGIAENQTNGVLYVSSTDDCSIQAAIPMNRSESISSISDSSIHSSTLFNIAPSIPNESDSGNQPTILFNHQFRI